MRACPESHTREVRRHDHSCRRTGPRTLSTIIYGAARDGVDALLDALFNAASASAELDLASDVDSVRGALTSAASSRVIELATASTSRSVAPLTLLLLIVRGLDKLSAANVTAVNVLMRLLDQGLMVDSVDGVVSLEASALAIVLPYDGAGALAGAPALAASTDKDAVRRAIVSHLDGLLASARAAAERDHSPIRAANPQALVGRVHSVVIVGPPAEEEDGAWEPPTDDCARRPEAVADAATGEDDNPSPGEMFWLNRSARSPDNFDGGFLMKAIAGGAAAVLALALFCCWCCFCRRGCSSSCCRWWPSSAAAAPPPAAATPRPQALSPAGAAGAPHGSADAAPVDSAAAVEAAAPADSAAAVEAAAPATPSGGDGSAARKRRGAAAAAAGPAGHDTDVTDAHAAGPRAASSRGPRRSKRSN